MAAWFTSRNLSGFANWYTVQAQEERDHATMLMNYILRVGGNAEFRAIEAPIRTSNLPWMFSRKRWRTSKGNGHD